MEASTEGGDAANATTKDQPQRPAKVRLTEINAYLTCYLCKGYLIDATTISECLHSFCRGCIIRFLEENSHCPVCEVIINKAKPNLKLDKILQDIVYKLVPGLFLNEMTRRKRFYKAHPEVAAKVSPEERGEDTERNIFNPQDCISLSLEYIRDDSTPGAIRLPVATEKSKQDVEESQMKRYLQCSGMCRIEVLKKFVRNKYSVDTSKFYIDILYKRVPLPDHYTLIDIAYIYSWKRNEPMTFYFRITDINKVTERFDYFDATKQPEPLLIVKTPVRSRSNSDRARKRASIINNNNEEATKTESVPTSQDAKKCDSVSDNKERIEEVEVKEGSKGCDVKLVEKVKVPDDSVNVSKDTKDQVKDEVSEDKVKCNVTQDDVCLNNHSETETKKTDNKPAEVRSNTSVVTNITLNRTNNKEVITKIQKVTKEGEPTKFIKQTVKTMPTNVKQITIPSVESLTTYMSKMGDPKTVDEEKQKYLKYLSLIPKIPQEVSKPTLTKKPSKPQQPNKRKNSSPVKNDKAKKAKLSKPSLQNFFGNCKITIPSSLSITLKDSDEGNSVPAPPVKNFIEILKIPDEKAKTDEDKPKADEDSDQKIDEDLSNIAKSLTENLRTLPTSTTVSQTTGPKNNFLIPVKAVPKYPTQPAPIPEISKALTGTSKTETVKITPRSPQSFQKIFEESLKKKSFGKSEGLDTSGNELLSGPTQKRNISEIVSQLCKRNQMEVELKDAAKEVKKEVVPKVAIPRLPTNRKQKPARPLKEKSPVVPKQIENLHSTALGFSYSVSVEQANKRPKLAQSGLVTPPHKVEQPNVSAASPKSPGKFNGYGTSPVKSPGELSIVLPPENEEEAKPVKVENERKEIGATPKLSENADVPKPSAIPKNLSPIFMGSPRNSPRHHSPKSSPVIKHMYAPIPGTLDRFRVPSPSNTKTPSPKPTKSPGSSPGTSLTSNQILEKYHIQNLAQLSANMSKNGYSLPPSTQMAAIQQAIILNNFELHKQQQQQQNWLTRSQYETYLQSLSPKPNNQLLGNIKEN